MGPTHGKKSTYYKHGCRCELCVACIEQIRMEQRTSELRRKLPVEPLYEVMSEKTRHQYRKSLYYWKNSGGISLYTADKVACQIGLHPYVIWGDEWFFRVNKHAFIKC